MLSRLRFGSLALLLLSACAPAPSGSTSSSNPVATAAPSVPRTLVYASSAISTNMDPATSIAGSARKYDVFETLTWYDNKGKIQPLLATRWESVDASTWRFTMRTDAKFHDGSAVTAKDVEFSWKRASDPALRSHVPGNMAAVESVTATDNATVQVKTKTPDPLLPRRFFYLAVLPQAYVERVGEQAFVAAPIGSGPFKLKEFKADDRIVLTGWMEHPYRKPKLTELTIRAVPDGSARVNGLRTGDLDAVVAVPLDAVPALTRDGFGSFNNDISLLGLLMDPIQADGTASGPFTSKQVRQAMNYAIDREAIAKSLWQGLAKPAGYVLSEGVTGYDTGILTYTYDQAKAKALIAQAGYPNGFQIKLEFLPSSAEVSPTMLAVQSQLKAIGVEVELITLDSPGWVDKIYKRKPPAPLLSTGSSPAPLYDGDGQFAFYWSASPFGKRYNNAEFDAKYLAQRQEMDPAKREALLKDTYRIFQEDPAWLGIVTSPTLTIWKKGVNMGPIAGDNTPFWEQISRS